MATNDYLPAISDGGAPEGAETPDAPRAQRRVKRRLGEILVTEGVCTEEAIDRALAVQQLGGGRLGSILVKLRLVTDEQIRGALRSQMGVTVIDLDTFDVDPSVLALVPVELVRKYEVIPFRAEGDMLWIAMTDPYNLAALDDIRFATGFPHQTVATCTESNFRQFMEKHLETQTVIDEILAGEEFYTRCLEEVDPDEEGEELAAELVHDLEIASAQSPVITLVNFLLVECIKRRASDIHIEPYETYLRVRFRVDGRLQTVLTPPRRLHSALIARCKVMSDLDIAKRRIPQDGHIAIVYLNETVHFRVSTLPTVYGEKCVMRLMKRDATLVSLDGLGFTPAEQKSIKSTFQAPQGLILVTGPTGSGKTTTLHAGIDFLNNPELNVVTLEDPVEATLADVNHVKIDERGGGTFASGLRSILRQDPDVVFVGEMRDAEVASIALRAALTGHLVLSTLHTNSAAETVLRLSDMGVPPFLLAGALSLVILQRLVRRVCTQCAEPHAPSDDDIAILGITPEQLASATPKKGRGCALCGQSGFRGRAGCYEILNVDARMRELIRTSATAEEMVVHAKTRGMMLVHEAALRRALAGETSFEEVRRLLGTLE